MSTTVNRKKLVNALQVAAKATEKRGSMPILRCVLMIPEGGALTVVGTDLEVAARVSMAADGLPGPSIALPAKDLLTVVKGFSEEWITFDWQDGARATIKRGTAQVSLAGTSGEEFPSLPIPAIGYERVDVPIEVLSDLSRVAHAMSKDETRYNMNGVCAEREGGVVRWIATDGHRLAYEERRAPWPTHEEPIIMASRFVLLLSALVNAKKPIDSRARISTDGTVVTADLGNTTLFGRLIQGKYYPNYRQVIPKDNGISLGFRVGYMAETLKRVAKIAGKKKAVRFTLSEGDCRVSTSNPDLGNAEEPLVAVYKGNPLTIGFNARYLIDAIDALDGDLASVDLHDASTPAIIREAREGSGFLAVVMPMRM